MKAIEDQRRTDRRPVLVRIAAPGPTTESRPSDEMLTFAVADAEEDGFCGECGQPLVGQAAARVWKEAEPSWWVWGLIALGVVLLISYGLSTLQVAQEPGAMRNLLSDHSASVVRPEGPSIRRAAFRAQDQLTPALDGIAFGLVTIVLGVSLIARRSARRRASGGRAPIARQRVQSSRAARSHPPRPVQRMGAGRNRCPGGVPPVDHRLPLLVDRSSRRWRATEPGRLPGNARSGDSDPHSASESRGVATGVQLVVMTVATMIHRG